MKRGYYYRPWYYMPVLKSDMEYEQEATQQVFARKTFLSLLQQRTGKIVTIVTKKDNVTGTLINVMADYITVQSASNQIYITISCILYFY